MSGSSGSSDYCEPETSVAPLHAQQRLCMVGREIREVSLSHISRPSNMAQCQCHWPIYELPVKRVNQNQIHSVILFALNGTEL